MVRFLGGKGVEVSVFGDGSVTVEGRPVLQRGGEILGILHTLVMVRGRVPRKVFFDRLEWSEENESHRKSFNQHLYTLRKKLGVGIDGRDPVHFEDSALAAMKVDLWEFLDLMEQDPPRLEEARKVLQGRKLYDPLPKSSRNDVWKKAIARLEGALKRLEEAEASPEAAPAGGSSAEAFVSSLKQKLLDHKVVPGVIDDQRVRDVQEILGRIKAMRSGEEGNGERSRAAVLADRLEGKAEGRSSRIVLIGGSGAGKEITAVMTCLELAERFERDPSPELVPIYVDAMRRGHEEGFGGEEWLAKLCEEACLEEWQKPLFVLTHADAFLALRDEIQAALALDLFQAQHLLVCCGATFYSHRLSFRPLQDADEERLEPWSRDFQEDFAEATVQPAVVEAFRRWLDENEHREGLCEVPLHLVFVLSLLAKAQETGEVSQELEKIFRPAELLEAVAHVRLRTSLSDGFDVDECLDLLGAAAHNFYGDPIRATRPPIQLSKSQLRALLSKGTSESEHPPKDWRDELVHGTLLTTSDHGQTFAFEHPIWGSFFVARHIDATLRFRPEETLQVFSKFLSAEVSILCEEMLGISARTETESLRLALRTALEDEDPNLDPDRIRIAREQICYFLGTIKHKGMQGELCRRVDPDSEGYEEDPLIRRAILFGLADGGSYRAANRYVERLRAEREASESSERDTNIGFHLTFRGDQLLDPGRPEAISKDTPCTRTVRALIRGLREQEHRGSWRIKLFTLLEMASHPRVDLKTFNAEFEKNLDDLIAIHEHLRDRRRSESWPELDELHRLIRQFENGKR